MKNGMEKMMWTESSEAKNQKAKTIADFPKNEKCAKGK